MTAIPSETTNQDHGAVPEGWTRAPVSWLIAKHFCGPSPDCEERQVASSSEWGVLKTTAITWNGWNEAAHKVLPRSYWGRNDLEVKHGDVLVTKAGPRDRVAVVWCT
jgi:type I restriction enzyme, S subunit